MKANESSKVASTKTISQKGSLFHEHWWLTAASGDQFSEVQIEDGNKVIARLPFIVIQSFGFTILKMPPFTHMLGPYVDCGEGKYQTLLKTRIKRTQQLVEKLPKFDYFFQIFDPLCDTNLALADGLAFQECGFRIGTQYSFHIDCRNNIETLFREMHLKSRQHVRLAEKVYRVISITDPQLFADFYSRSLKAKGLDSNIPLDRFPHLYSECHARGCGEVLAAVDANGAPIAMTFLVWDGRAMYYLLSARSPEIADKGSVNLLIWSAMKKANELGLIFDLDGVSTAGTAQFLAGFGGELKTRMIVTRAGPLYATLQHFGRMVGFGNTSFYS